jgi:hypothetical protein
VFYRDASECSGMTGVKIRYLEHIIFIFGVIFVAYMGKQKILDK